MRNAANTPRKDRWAGIEDGLVRARATRTATLARRLIEAGMILIGKTHMVEFAFGGWGTNQHLGTPWNPWDARVARIPCGSSSGSSVAVAARTLDRQRRHGRIGVAVGIFLRCSSYYLSS